MATQFDVPNSPSKSIFQMNYFQGCDFTNSAANVDDYKSPNCVNMIRDVPGKIRKSMGYKTQITYPGKINGSYFLRDSEEQLIHAGTGIYHNNVLLYDSANDTRSIAWQFDDKLYIQDGKELLVHECTKGDDADLEYTRGTHTETAAGAVFSVSMKIKDSATVYFKWDKPVTKFDATRSDGTSVEVEISDEGATEYTWTNSLGAADITFKFYMNYEAEEKETSAGSFTVTLGNYATINFSDDNFHSRTCSSFKVAWTDKMGVAHTEDVSNYSFTNETGNTFSFTFTWTIENTRTVSGSTSSAGRLSLYLNKGDTVTFKSGTSQAAFTVKGLIGNISSTIATGVGSWTNTESDGTYTFYTVYPVTVKATSANVSTTYTVPSSWISSAKSASTTDAKTIVVRATEGVTGYEWTKTSGSTITSGYQMYSELQEAVTLNISSYTSVKFYVYGCADIHMDTSKEISSVTVEDTTTTPALTAEIYDAGEVQSTVTYIVGKAPNSDGFIDDTDGEYLDEEGYYRTIKKVADDAYIPTVTIAKIPTGGGTSYEDLNLIQPYFIETFYGSTADGTTYKTFQLSFKGLTDASKTKAWVLNSSGSFVEKTYGTDFTVNATTGVVTFSTAPGKSPDSETPNVKIQAYRVVEGYADRVNKCTFSTLFGVNGNPDRMFISGNPDYPNYDWYSNQYDPTYFPDTGYSVLGSASSKIIGYSVINNYLAAHKDDKERDMNIILRQGNLEDSEPAFPVVATLQGAGAVATWSFGYLETEPIFLTKRGIYAVTAQDITGEKYSQNRSYYMDGKLLEEENLDQAYACIYNDFYILALNGKLYILDGLQPIQTDKSMPYATRQYACFYRENVPATCIWTFNDELYFGTEDGKVCKFYKDKDDLYSYNDDGEPIECVWETPDLDGKYFFKNKTFRYIAIRLDSAIATSINIYTMKRGIWSLAKTDSTKARYFSFPYLNFGKFSFSTDTTQKIIHTKLRLKKVDKARFRFTNTALNEPFGLFDVALEYIENGNYKN